MWQPFTSVHSWRSWDKVTSYYKGAHRNAGVDERRGNCLMCQWGVPTRCTLILRILFFAICLAIRWIRKLRTHSKVNVPWSWCICSLAGYLSQPWLFLHWKLQTSRFASITRREVWNTDSTDCLVLSSECGFLQSKHPKKSLPNARQTEK